MSELRSYIILQQRWHEFLAQQDDATLEAIVGGTVRLALVPAAEVEASTAVVPSREVPAAAQTEPVGPATVPSSREPTQVAQGLVRLESEQERRIYLNAAELPLSELKKVAKLCGLVGYSKLTRPKLLNLLVGQRSDATDGSVTARTTPSAAASPPATREPNAAAATIATRLRETETEEQGVVYLREQNLDREGLLAVAAELQLTRVERLSRTELEKRVLRQAIGARRKFAGLRSW